MLVGRRHIILGVIDGDDSRCLWGSDHTFGWPPKSSSAKIQIRRVYRPRLNSLSLHVRLLKLQKVAVRRRVGGDWGLIGIAVDR
jgi:hypothetical protein